MKYTLKDKQLIRDIADHFKFSLGDAIEIFKYAQYKKKTQNAWLIGKCKKAVSIKEVRKITKGIPAGFHFSGY